VEPDYFIDTTNDQVNSLRTLPSMTYDDRRWTPSDGKTSPFIWAKNRV